MKKRTTDTLNAAMIAACGMNCSLCIGYLRDKKPCSGCNGDDAHKPKSCVVCQIKNCEQIQNSELKFCFVCAGYPCLRLRKLDKRYRTKYGVSMIENLGNIHKRGLDVFLRDEKERWRCPECGGILSVHRDLCVYCGRNKSG